ncbi:MAG: NAD(+) diphosphatase [Thermodesulfobacteriota bacterium]
MERSFIPAILPPLNQSGRAWWFILSGFKLLMADTEQGETIPLLTDARSLGLEILEETFLGTLEGRPCFAALIARPPAPPPSMAFLDLRRLDEQLDEEWIHLAFRAFHLLDWSQKTRFCKKCGSELIIQKTERAKKCPECGHQSFPRISPAVIVLIERGDECLLARSPRFQDGFYSVLAGFAEPGETLEATVRREILEETGIEVKDIRYFGSQPWPFPDSLMIGFTCQYASGEIKVDETEILDAHWFRYDQLPKIPGRISIARRLIDWFVSEHQTPK